MKYQKIELFLAASLLILSYPTAASPTAPKSGVDYAVVGPAKPLAKSGPVQVVEFFSYSCPHCREFEKPLKQWAGQRSGKVELVQVPVDFGKHSVLNQRLFYALEGSGQASRLHAAVFERYRRRDGFESVDEILDFVAAHGIDRKAFAATLDSAAVAAKVARARTLQDAYRVKGVPVLVVNGAYLTSPGFFHKKRNIMTQLSDWISSAGQPEKSPEEAAEMMMVLQTVDALVDSVRKSDDSAR